MIQSWDVNGKDCKSCHFWPGERSLIMVGSEITGIRYENDPQKCSRIARTCVYPITTNCPNFMRWLQLPQN